MSEQIRTTIFVVVAVVLGAAAYGTLPRSSSQPLNSRVNQPLFKDFDPEKAVSLEITRFDTTLGKAETFKVAKVKDAKGNSTWCLPSHSNYPADAENQLRDAASSLLAAKVLGIATEDPNEHKEYGVISPEGSKAEANTQGTGMLVVMRNESNDDLIRMVIGMQDSQSPDQRFVRIGAGAELQDTVFVAKIDPEKLPTDFAKWIEADLLKVNPMDVAKVTLKDYSVVPTVDPNGRRVNVLDMRSDATVSFNNQQNAWSLERFRVYQKNKPVDVGLREEEELNKATLDELKKALDDLKIEDVVPKPAGMSKSLKVSASFAENNETLQSLMERGFLVRAGKDGEELDIVSSNGEVLLDTVDGIRYVLRFGNVAQGLLGIQKGSGGAKVNRYLLVTAELSDETLVPPVLLPEEVPGEAKKPAAAEGEAGSAEEAKEEPAKEGDKPAKAEGDEAEKPSTVPPPEAKVAENPQLELIRKENKRRVDEFETKKKKATQRVMVLNSRFADWYYVISEDVYKKVHLGRSDIIKENAQAKDGGFGPDAFRKLENDGLKADAPAAGGPPGGIPGFPGFPPM